MEDRVLREGDIVRHFKNKEYSVKFIGENTETNELMVGYVALYGEHKRYVRPYIMFMSEVDREKYPDVKQMYRFEIIGHQEDK